MRLRSRKRCDHFQERARAPLYARRALENARLSHAEGRCSKNTSPTRPQAHHRRQHHGLDTKAFRCEHLLFIAGIRHSRTSNPPGSSTATIGTARIQTSSQQSDIAHITSAAYTQATCVSDVHKKARSDIKRFGVTSARDFHWQALRFRMEGRRDWREGAGRGRQAMED